MDNPFIAVEDSIIKAQRERNRRPVRVRVSNEFFSRMKHYAYGTFSMEPTLDFSTKWGGVPVEVDRTVESFEVDYDG